MAMPDNPAETLQEVISEIALDPKLSLEDKERMLRSLRKLKSPLETDPWIYRGVIGALGLAVLLTLVFTFVLARSLPPDGRMPEGLVAIGSAAVGALAGLLAPTPRSQ